MRTMHALAVSLLLLGWSGLADAKRPPPITDEERTVVQVFDAPGSTKDQIYAASKLWIAENFKSAEAVVDYDDPSEGTIIGNGNMAYTCDGGFACSIRRDAWRVTFKMKVEAKDGRFRLTFTNVELLLPTGPSPITQREDLENIRAELLKFGPEIAARVGEAQGADDW